MLICPKEEDFVLLVKSHQMSESHLEISHKAVCNAYLWAILLTSYSEPVSSPAYFSRDTMEADSWS